jgi:hypothetical protein
MTHCDGTTFHTRKANGSNPPWQANYGGFSLFFAPRGKERAEKARNTDEAALPVGN